MATTAEDQTVILSIARTPMGSMQGALAEASATDLGASRCVTAATAAIRSRSSKWPRASVVSLVGSSAWISPGSERECTGKPLSRSTPSMR